MTSSLPNGVLVTAQWIKEWLFATASITRFGLVKAWEVSRTMPSVSDQLSGVSYRVKDSIAALTVITDKCTFRPMAFYLPQFHPIPENDCSTCATSAGNRSLNCGRRLEAHGYWWPSEQVAEEAAEEATVEGAAE